MTAEQHNAEIVNAVRAELAPAFAQLSPEDEPAPAYRLDDHTGD